MDGHQCVILIYIQCGMINTKSKKQELILVCSNPKFRGNNANKSACKDYSRIRNSS